MEHRAGSGNIIIRADEEAVVSSLSSPLLSRSASSRASSKTPPMLQRVGSMHQSGPVSPRPGSGGFLTTCNLGGLVIMLFVGLTALSYVGFTRASAFSTTPGGAGSMDLLDMQASEYDNFIPSDGQEGIVTPTVQEANSAQQPQTGSSRDSIDSASTASGTLLQQSPLPAPSPSPSRPPPSPLPNPSPKPSNQLTALTPIIPVTPDTPYTYVCPDTSKIRYSINGVEVKPSQLIPTLESVTGPQGAVLTLVANGTCGPFVGPSTTFYLRATAKGADLISTDIAVFRDMYLRHEFKFLKKRLAALPARRIMDLGTNMGLSLIYWSIHYPEAQIVGVEPELHNFGLAGLNIAHRPNVWLERAAVTDRVGFGSLKSMARGDWGWGAKQEDQVLHAEHGFASVTVPYLMKKYKWDTIDYLKIDIEGSELELCKDILNGAEWINNVRCVTFEMHDRLRPEAQPSVLETCQEALKKVKMRFLGHHRVDHLYFWCRK